MVIHCIIPAGVWWEDLERGRKIAEILDKSSNSELKGVYVHCGNTYVQKSVEDVTSTRNETIGRRIISQYSISLEPE